MRKKILILKSKRLSGNYTDSPEAKLLFNKSWKKKMFISHTRKNLTENLPLKKYSTTTIHMLLGMHKLQQVSTIYSGFCTLSNTDHYFISCLYCGLLHRVFSHFCMFSIKKIITVTILPLQHKQQEFSKWAYLESKKYQWFALLYYHTSLVSLPLPVDQHQDHLLKWFLPHLFQPKQKTMSGNVASRTRWVLIFPNNIFTFFIGFK